jgi:hypothetical protein
VLLQEAVLLCPVVHEGGLQAPFYPCDYPFVYIASVEFTASGLNTEIFQPGPLYKGNPAFLGIYGINEDLVSFSFLCHR